MTLGTFWGRRCAARAGWSARTRRRRRASGKSGQRLVRRAAQFLGREDEDPLPAEMRNELPQLQCVVADVADDVPTADGRQHVAAFGRPLHFPPIMADRAFDRIAEQVEDARVGGEPGDPLGHPFIVRELGVVGRRLAAVDRVAGVGKQAAVPVFALGPVEPFDEIGGLLPRFARHEDLRVRAEIVVQRRGAALHRSDEKQVGQRVASNRKP